MEKKVKFTIKPKDDRNEMHLAVQLHNKAAIYKPKKGKGSFKRREKHPKKDVDF